MRGKKLTFLLCSFKPGNDNLRISNLTLLPKNDIFSYFKPSRCDKFNFLKAKHLIEEHDRNLNLLYSIFSSAAKQMRVWIGLHFCCIKRRESMLHKS